QPSRCLRRVSCSTEYEFAAPSPTYRHCSARHVTLRSRDQHNRRLKATRCGGMTSAPSTTFSSRQVGCACLIRRPASATGQPTSASSCDGARSSIPFLFLGLVGFAISTRRACDVGGER